MPGIDVTHPDVAAQWHPTLNGELTPADVTAGCHAKAWWKCPNKCSEGCEHLWQSEVRTRCLRNYECPWCCYPQKRVCIHNSIQYTHPLIVAEWHPTKNGNLLPSNYGAGSGKKIWWKCNKLCIYGCVHEWYVSIDRRCSSTSSTGCPYCCSARKQSCIHESIQYTHPLLAIEWHPTKNNNIEIKNITFGSDKKIWWKCKNRHEWFASVSNRTRLNRGCPYCINKSEAKLLAYLKKSYPDIQPQFRPPWCKSPITGRRLPFDFYIPSLKLLIELDGAQHFRQVANWNSCESTRKKDVFKMRAAFKQGLSVVRILQEDVLAATDEWLNETLLPHLVLHTEPDCTFIVNDEQPDIYDDHQRLLEGDDETYAESVESE